MVRRGHENSSVSSWITFGVVAPPIKLKPFQNTLAMRPAELLCGSRRELGSEKQATNSERKFLV